MITYYVYLFRTKQSFITIRTETSDFGQSFLDTETIVANICRTFTSLDASTKQQVSTKVHQDVD